MSKLTNLFHLPYHFFNWGSLTAFVTRDYVCLTHKTHTQKYPTHCVNAKSQAYRRKSSAVVIPRKHYLFITPACIGVWVTVAYMRNIRGLFLNLVCRHPGLTDKAPKWLGSFLSTSLQYDWYSVWCASLTLIRTVMTEFKLCCWLGRQCTKSCTVHPLDSEMKMHPSNRARKVWFAILCSLLFLFASLFLYFFIFCLKCAINSSNPQRW